MPAVRTTLWARARWLPLERPRPSTIPTAVVSTFAARRRGPPVAATIVLAGSVRHPRIEATGRAGEPLDPLGRGHIDDVPPEGGIDRGDDDVPELRGVAEGRLRRIGERRGNAFQVAAIDRRKGLERARRFFERREVARGETFDFVAASCDSVT